MFKVISKFKDRTILPYQAGYEYHKNRLKVISDQFSSYDDLCKELEKQKNDIENILNGYKHHSYIDADSIKEKINNAITKSIKEINKQKSSHPDWLTDDTINAELIKVFKNVSEQYTEEELKKIYNEGKERYKNSIPPGYKDQKGKENKGENSLYGDLIIWKHLKKIATDKKQSIVFVTDDRKEDWWQKHNGETIGPRYELIKEFKQKTNQDILIYNSEQFLKYSSKFLKFDLNATSFNEVESIRKIDEFLSLIREDNVKNQTLYRLANLNISNLKKENLRVLNDDFCDKNLTQLRHFDTKDYNNELSKLLISNWLKNNEGNKDKDEGEDECEVVL